MSEPNGKEANKGEMSEAEQKAQEALRQAQEADPDTGGLFEMIDELPPEMQEKYRQQATDAINGLLDAFEPIRQAVNEAQEDLTDSPEESQGAAALKAAAAEANRLTNQTAETIRALISETAAGAAVNASNNAATEIRAAINAINAELQETNRRIEESLNRVLHFWDSSTFEKLQESLAGFSEWYGALMQKEVTDLSADELIYIGDFTDNIEALLPIIQEETEAYKKETGADRLTVEEFFRDTDPDTGEPIDSIYDKVLQRAQQQPEKDAAAAEAARRIISIGAHKVKELDYPVDKVNNSIWGLLQENTHGQLTLQIKADANKSKNPIDIMYSINFDEIENESGLPIVKHLTQYDKRVYVAAGGLYNSGNDIVTISMLYQAMGYKGEPGKSDREKINKSLTKMGARVTIDNWQEIHAKYKYPKFRYDGDLLPFERLTPADAEITIDGRTADEYIHFFREPPLLTFAKGRKQVTTIDQKLLQTPLSKTEQNIAIEDYCIERIAQYRREGRKILLSTLYKKCNITTRKQKERTPEKIKRLFDYYVQCGEIRSYTLTADAIIFNMPRPALPIKEK